MQEWTHIEPPATNNQSPPTLEIESPNVDTLISTTQIPNPLDQPNKYFQLQYDTTHDSNTLEPI